MAYEFSLAIEISATPERVWRALCDPSEVVRWESGVSAALDAPADYPRPGQHVRWRTSGGVFRILHDRPQEVLSLRRLRSLLAVGPWRYDETYEIEPVAAGCRLDVRLAVTSSLPVVGGLAVRILAGPVACGDFRAALDSIKRYCESQ